MDFRGGRRSGGDGDGGSERAHTRFRTHIHTHTRSYIHTPISRAVTRERKGERGRTETGGKRKSDGEGDEGDGAGGKVRSVGSSYTYTHRDITRQS